MNTAEDICSKIGIAFKQVPTDGKWYQTDADGKHPKNGNGRIKLFTDGTGGMVHNWTTMDKPEVFFFDSGVKLSATDIAERKRRIEQERAKADQELAEERERAAGVAVELWKAAKSVKAHPYLDYKQVSATLTIKQLDVAAVSEVIGYHPKTKGQPLTGSILVVPIGGKNGISSIEMIDESGKKAALYGGQKAGCYWMTGRPSEGADLFVIGEGVSTTLSGSLAMDCVGVAALSCHNLKAVALQIRQNYPAARIIILSDVGNGEDAAQAAALSVNGYLMKPIFPDSSTGTDANDLHVKSGLDELKRQILAVLDVEPISPSSNDDSEQEQQAANSFPQVGFPFEVFPDYFQELVKDYSKALQCDAAFMAMNFLTVISGAVGNSITVEIKRGWRTAVFLWFSVIDKSGGGKTHPQNAAMKPLLKLQSIEGVKFEHESNEYKADKAAYDRDKKSGGGDPPSEPEPMRHYYSQNFTIEALIPMFKKSARGIVVYVDELAGLLKGMGQYKGGKNSDDEQLLSLFNCDALKSDRVKNSGFSRESGAAVLGGIQPEIFATVFGDKEAANGMLFRFLPMVLNLTPPMFSDDELSEESEEKWENIIAWMYSIPATIDPLTGHIVKNTLKVDDAGKKAWKEFHDELSAVQLFMPSRFQGYLPKFKTYCLKFMGILHLINCYECDGLALTINESTVNGAIKLTRYFAGEALQLVKGAVVAGNPYHAFVHKAIDAIRGETDGGKVSLTRVREKLNELLPPEIHIGNNQNKMVSTWLREIGFAVAEGTGHKSYVLIL
jgi:phage/plasmid primase-like uncharacterized protein